jgi:hypothetical protein
LADCPPGKHPASPRFLLSLLATAVFLSITPIATQAMSSILNTIGPYTVIRYLNFALGKGIGDPEAGEPDAAVGLEGVAEILKDEEESILEVDEISAQTPRALSILNPLEKLKDCSLDDLRHDFSIEKEDPAQDSSGSSTHSDSLNEAPDHHFFYGVVSDKIGEAVACWLARWGLDMLQHELQVTCREPVDSVANSQFSGNRKRASTVPGPEFCGSGSTSLRSSTVKASATKHYIPLIWRRGGLTARWVRGLLSSDVFFVPGEKERFDIARRVVELRRAEGILEEEEVEYDVLFVQGFYYANMVSQKHRCYG